MAPHPQSRAQDVRTVSNSPSVAAYALEVQRIWQRLAETYHAHDLAGILPARRHYALKRMLDLALGVPALLVTLPLYPLITLLIQRDSPGPGLFRQVRIGKDGRPFVAYKFRTMRQMSPEQARAAHLEIVTRWMAGEPVDADAAPDTSLVATPAAAGQATLTLSEASISRYDLSSVVTAMFHSPSQSKQVVVMPHFKHTNDQRITPIGHILRKLSIDELPQIINVVRGEMSLVGPRPSTPYEVERYHDRALARLRAAPGLTGQWQVEGRGRVGFDEMVEMDLNYTTKSSLWRDIALILLTIPAVIKGDGAG
jgi:lipopolysaccharide/colanic/teichoic acid biosynthesis glycosyltransferase